ncbi:DUF4129 domain-containing transglutaminase family protein [Peribacillus sp. SCS-155]|uniref:DUF4129 domain-containing transglutaminase family protein n=1 Tax=Peribacillus sedimenti TaxID=3115297 RepID=UPI003905B404
MIQETRMNRNMHALLYILAFFLLWEWLGPVKQLMESSKTTVFVVFMGLSLLFHYLRIRFLLRFIVLTGYTLLAVRQLYYDHSIFDLTWIFDFVGSLFENISYMVSGDFREFSFEFQTILVFVLLWLVTYLLHYWIRVKKNIFLFFLLTVIYVSVLDTFTPYVGTYAIIRLVVIGFSMLGILALFRLADVERFAISVSDLRKWLVPLAVMVGFSSYVGLAAPKLEPQWSDPVPFIKSYSDKVSGNGTGGGVNKIGYDEDDSALGGGFIGDDSVVFQAKATEKHYWKVEHKDYYTGKGWEYLNPDEEFTQFNDGEQTNFSAYSPDVKTTEETAEVTVSELHRHVVYPEPLGITKLTTSNGSMFRYYLQSERITAHNYAGNSRRLKQYKIEYQIPSFDTEELKKVKSLDELPPGQLMEKYLQLPEQLPARVRQLAEEITSGKTNWYDKAKAVEDYFDGGQFVYDQNDIPYPSAEQDYVDQFLFETMRGYCDNFSTSMVVLLRSAGIPARWVKGYTSGDEVLIGSDRVYQVTNNNAHSWVEVYFPNAGWVPFEPTKGYTNQAIFVSSSTADAGGTIGPDEEPPVRDIKKPETDQAEVDKAAVGSSLEQKNWFAENRKIIIFSVIILTVAALIFYRTRRKWLPKLIILIYSRNQDDKAFEKAYSILLKQLKRSGLKRPEGQTLREYADYIDTYFFTNEMKQLTQSYERSIYRGDSATQEWQKSRKLWENLIKTTAS